MNELSLFTGIGGGVYASKLLGWRTIGYVEKDEYCQRVIRARIDDGTFDDAPIYSDIRTFNVQFAHLYQGVADIVTGGFPCQPHSWAGRMQGARDDRDLWPETLECIRIVGPRFVLLENVRGLVSSGYLGRVVGELAESGYSCRWRVLSAAEVGAPHKRDRIWILAYPHGTWELQQERRIQAQRRWPSDSSEEMAYAASAGLPGSVSSGSDSGEEEDVPGRQDASHNEPSGQSGRTTESVLDRTFDGDAIWGVGPGTTAHGGVL